MTRVIQLSQPGSVERLLANDVELPAPSSGQIRLRQRAIGLNFVDVYQRTGFYPLPGYPAVLGVEAAGEVVAVGPDVTHVRPGDRVAYAGEVGAYAEERLLPAFRAVRLPDGISDALGAVLLARGLTVHMLQTEVFAVKEGTLALVHSAAGGLGGLLVRWARARGATVIATVGSEAKADLARAHGADHVIVGRDADFGAAVRAWTGGRGVDVAYDGVGGTTLRRTLDCVRPFGTVASFGQSAGPIPPLPVEEIGPRRSLSLCRPSVMLYMTDPVRYLEGTRAVIAAAEAGITPSLGQAYPLAEVARAHADLEAGRTQGCPVLVP